MGHAPNLGARDTTAPPLSSQILWRQRRGRGNACVANLAPAAYKIGRHGGLQLQSSESIRRSTAHGLRSTAHGLRSSNTYRPALGSNASLRPSPMKLMLSTASAIVIPAGTQSQGICCMTAADWAVLIRFPQLGVGGCTSIPKNERPASVKIEELCLPLPDRCCPAPWLVPAA